MNYMTEINTFNDWCEKHYLPMKSQFLWYKLMAKNNRLGWCEWMSVDNLELMGILRTNREATVIDVRNKLLEAGLIEYVKGKKGMPNQYKMISLSKLKVNTVVESVVQPEVKSVVNTVVHTADINKHKQDINKKEKSKKEIPPPIPFAEIMAAESDALKNSVLEFVKFRESLKKPFLNEMQLKKWLVKLKKMGNEETQIAIIDQSIINGWQGLFPLKDDFSNNKGKNNSSGEATGNRQQNAKPNRYVNFKQRDWDYEQIEKLERENVTKFKEGSANGCNA